MAKQPFSFADFPGFESRRNKGGQSFQNSHSKKHVGNDMQSYVYTFSSASSKDTNRSITDCQTNDSESDNGASIETYDCKYCGKVFRTPQGLFTHSRQVRWATCILEK